MNVVLNAHLLSARAGYRSAGIHGYIYHTLKHLPDAAPDWHFDVLVGAGNPPEHPQLTAHRSRFSTEKPLKRIFWEQTIQPRELSRMDFDLYHGMAFVLPPRLRQPGIVTVYDLSFIRYPDALSMARRMYLNIWARRSCRKAARIIAISESTAHDLVTLLNVPREKISVAVPGVSSEFHPIDAAAVADFKQKNGLPDRFLLHVGTLEPRKNLVMLLNAYAALPESTRRAVHLVLAGGKGWDYQGIFAAIESHDLTATVHLPGYVAEETLPLWYNAADALVYPSQFEGWGLPVVEAMACGCPTIVSDVSSLPEAAGDTGKCLPPDDPAAWTAALHDAINNAAWRQQSGQAGMHRAVTFTWAGTASATRQAYQTALNRF
jgi:glycosyltransferase involved in cell wall biosynthesis